jgi:hypothetical protein
VHRHRLISYAAASFWATFRIGPDCSWNSVTQRARGLGKKIGLVAAGYVDIIGQPVEAQLAWLSIFIAATFSTLATTMAFFHTSTRSASFN